ncbi:hypothetical protein FNYG_11957 [Fusarium nygamai]|uniref:Uncharacterized protein n=1 Tax=Gibberella nygamai TaxID=42673 RepID=A0A2K0VX74_GIBNY|nr:hypothetical protein FNYG_11957 [Fusarium nygamai]
MAASSASCETKHAPSDISGYLFLYQDEGGGHDGGQRTSVPAVVPRRPNRGLRNMTLLISTVAIIFLASNVYLGFVYGKNGLPLLCVPAISVPAGPGH